MASHGTRFCPNCGTARVADLPFCPGCGRNLDALADHLTIIVEGAIIYAKALRDPDMMGRQTRLFRNHIKLLFGA